MTQPRDYNRFAVVPIYADSTGREAAPQNALFVGSQSAVMERILDSRARRTALSIINDAEHAKGTLHSIRQRERDVADREEAVKKREDAQTARELQDAMRKFDTTLARFDIYEAELNHDPDDDELPLPPGSGDDGELEASHPPSRDKHTEQLAATEDEEQGGVPLSYGNVPTTYVHGEDGRSRGEDQSNELPPEVERRTPASGTMPVYDPRDLAHPQKPQQQPLAIGDDEDLPSPPPVSAFPAQTSS